MVNIGRLAMLARFTLLVLAGAAVGLQASPARAVIWTFYETSCVANDGSNCTYQPPGGLAQLTLPDINSSGTWSGFYNASTHSFTETGDTNFLFQLTGSSLQAPGLHPAAPSDMLDNIEFDIAFASSPMSLSIAAIYTAAFNDVCIRQGSVMVPASCPAIFGEFFVATDFSLVGCNFTQCQITGNWILALVPEPSSLGSLGSALLGLLSTILLFASRRNGASAVPLIGATRT